MFSLFCYFDSHVWYHIGTENLFASVQCIYWSGSLWLIGTDNSMFYSYNSIHWLECDNTTSLDINDICYNGNNLYIALKNTPGIAYSLDGIHWRNHQDTLSDVTLNACVWNGSFFVAVGSNTGGTQSIFKSSDGFSWVQSTNNPFMIGNDICWTGTRFIVAGSGDDNHVATSVDGMNWVGNGLISATTGMSCVSSHGAIAVCGSGIELFYSSDHGLNWSSVSPSIFNVGIKKISFQNQRFIAIGEGTSFISYSFDGLLWYHEMNHDIFSTAIPLCVYKSYQEEAERNQILLTENLEVSTEFFQHGFYALFVQ